MNPRRAVAALAAFGLLLVGCSGPLPGEAVANAATKAREQGSAKVFMQISTTSGGATVEMEGSGELDMEGQTGYMTMTPTGESAATGPAASLGSMEIVFADFVAYMRMEGFEQFLPQGKQWIKIDFRAVGKELGFDFAQLQQLGQGDPSQQLDYLRGATEVAEAGTEEVRGVETTHYTAVLDMAKAAEEFPEAEESLTRLRELSGIEKAPMEVWLDSDGLPRRLTFDFEIDPPADASPALPPSTSSMMIEYYDYGVDVEVSIPSEAEVFDPAQLQG